MFELPKPIQVDQTPVKLLYQAAAEAKEYQSQMLQLALKNEQIRREAFGGAQKQLMDIAGAQNVPVEVQNNILKNGMDQLTKMYKDRKGIRSTEMSMMAADLLLKAKQNATAFQQYLTNGDKIIANLKERGFDEVNMKTALSNSIFNTQTTQGPNGLVVVRTPKDPSSLGDPIEFLTKEVDANKQKYLNREKSVKALDTFIGDYKPSELKQSTTKDVTGTKTVKVAYTEKVYPWTTVKDQKDDATGQTVKINVLDTEPLTDGSGNVVFDANGEEIRILSTDAYNRTLQAIGGNVLAVSEIDAMGRDAIDDHNRKLGLNPQQITESNFNQVLSTHPNAINPFDANNRMIYSRLALSKKLMPQFGKFGDTSVTVDVAKPSTTNVYNSGGLYNRSGNLRPEAKFPSAWAQIVNQDADIMRVAENMSFQYQGKTITGRKTGDRAQGQILKDNGKRATVVSRPEEPGVIYVVELDSDGEPTDVVTKLSGQQAIDYGAKISSANGSDIKTFNKYYSDAMTTVVPMTDADKNNIASDVDRSSALQEGQALLGRVNQIRSMGEDETITANDALVKLQGKEVRIRSIYREDTPPYKDSPIKVTLSDGRVWTYKNRDVFVKDLINSNK